MINRALSRYRFTHQPIAMFKRTFYRNWARLPRQWSISLHLLDPGFFRLGTPYINLFVTYANKKIHHFAYPFLCPDPQTTFIDAILIPWSGLRTVYTFPPFMMIPRILAKIQQFHGLTVLFIAAVDAGATPAVSVATHFHGNGWEATAIASSAAARWRNQDVALPAIRPSHMETLKALFHKLGYDEHVIELLTFTLHESSINLYWDSSKIHPILSVVESSFI